MDDAFSLAPLKQALSSLEQIRDQKKDPVVRDAVIQRFEYSFELCWKTLKRYFKINNNLDEDNVKNLFREGGKQGLIEDVEAWFGFQQARNLTSHTYSEKVAEEVYEAAKKFLPKAQSLLLGLEKLNG